MVQVTALDPGLDPVAVNVTGLPDSVPEDAVTVLIPAELPKVSELDARPRIFVVVLVAVKVPPPETTAKVTFTPETGFPPESVTLTTNGRGSSRPMMPVWPDPLDMTNVVGVGELTTPVAVNVTGLPAKVPELAVTAFVPAADPKVRMLEARPRLLVVATDAVNDPPPETTLKLTLTPDTALPLASVTLTTNGLDSCCPTLPV